MIDKYDTCSTKKQILNMFQILTNNYNIMSTGETELQKIMHNVKEPGPSQKTGDD